MDIDDHIPQDKEPEFSDTLHELIEAEDYDAASELLSQTMLDFFYDYVNEPEIFGLLKQANHIKVSAREGTTVWFDTKHRCMYIPHRVAHRIENAHDIACLMLVERARLIVNRTAHMYLPTGMDLTQHSHKAIFEMAIGCWSIALARCYCASILPERLYAPHSDMWHNLMHGLDPDGLITMIRGKFPNIAKIYSALYKQGGQEQYHFMLNRVAPEAIDTLSFYTVLPYFWEDLKKSAPSNEQIEEMMEAILVKNPSDGEDEKPIEAQKAMKSANDESSYADAVPTADIDIEDPLDEYLADYVRMSFNANSLMDIAHGLTKRVPDLSKLRASFSGMNHTVMLEAQNNEDQSCYGSITPPEHVSMHDLAHYAQGYPPPLWETRMSPAESQKADVRYDIYFDISGSMTEWFPIVRSMITQLGVYVNPDHIYGFSTVVEKIDMSGSFLMTTGGTRIGCAIQHMRARHGTHAIVITDLEDFSTFSTEGIEHLIIVGTDTTWTTETFDVSKTVFGGADVNTKIDFLGLKIKELTKTTTNKFGSFNTKRKI